MTHMRRFSRHVQQTPRSEQVVFAALDAINSKDETGATEIQGSAQSSAETLTHIWTTNNPSRALVSRRQDK